MCTYSPHYPALVAEHPIKCYKYLYKSPNGEYLTPYQLTPVEKGMTYKISEEQLKNRQICVLQSYRAPYLIHGEEEFEDKYGGEKFFEIGEGAFHSFIDYGPCTDRFNKHSLDAIKQKSMLGPAIAVCYIPAGTKYFTGWFTICSTATIISYPTTDKPWLQPAEEHCYSAQGDPDCYASEEIFYAKIYDNLKDFYKNEAPNKMW